MVSHNWPLMPATGGVEWRGKKVGTELDSAGWELMTWCPARPTQGYVARVDRWLGGSSQ